MSNRTPVHFDGLNALRFFSAFAIVIYRGTLGVQSKVPDALRAFLHNLSIGVDMFFLVSGFLIIYLLLHEKAETGSLSISKFYSRRVLRIFPLYYLIIGIAYFAYHANYPGIDFSKFICFVGNFWMIKIDSWSIGILNPLWSLCIEEQFYLVIPLLILLIPVRYLKYLFWVIIFTSFIYRGWITATAKHNWMSIYCHTLSRCDLLAIGGLLAYHHHISKFKINVSGYFLLGVLTYLILLMANVDSSDYTTLIKATLNKMLFALPLLLIFMGLVLNKNEESKVVKWIKTNSVINYLGKISFGLYMYYTMVVEFVDVSLKDYNSFLLRISTIIILTVLLSVISYECFEKRIINLKRYFKSESDSS